MKKWSVLLVLGCAAAATVFAQGTGRAGKIHLGMGTEIEISKTADGSASATSGDIVVPIDFLMRFIGQERGGLSLGFTMRFGIGFPQSFNWHGSLPVLVDDDGYYEIGQTQTRLWTFERGGANLFKFNCFFGAAGQMRIFSALSFIFEAGLAVHHASASWNMLNDSGGGGWNSGGIYYDYDYYDEMNATVSDTTLGIGLNAGLHAEFSMFYIEAGVGASYDFLHTTSGKIKLENSYSEITYRKYNAKTDTINLFVLSVPYVLLGVSF